MFAIFRSRCRSIICLFMILTWGICLHLSCLWLAVSFRRKQHTTFSPFRRLSVPQRMNPPEFAAWDLFARNKSSLFLPSESITDIQSLPCIQTPIDGITQNLNSFVCLLRVVSPAHAPSSEEVSAVLHLTKDRMQHIQLTCSRWGGPVIAILFLYPHDLPLLTSLVKTAKAIQTNHQNCVKHLELYVAVDIRPNGSYPVNLLRNIGLLTAVTSRVVSLDADFIPSLNAAVALSKLSEPEGSAPSAYILPVFQFDGHGHLLRLPSDKKELLAMIMLNLATPMLQDCPPQHFTNYAAWPNATSPYMTTFGSFYEPYVMLSRGRQNPLFSELFLSSGNDKNSLHFELHAARYQYFVHPEHFLFHIPHATNGNWKNPSNFEVVAWNNLKIFLTHLQTKYQYDLPHNPLEHNGRIMSGHWHFSPPVSEWIPMRLDPGIWVSRPAPAILHAFQPAFFLDAELLNVKIPLAILTENALFLNMSDPCEISEECVIMGPVGFSCTGACAALNRVCSAPRISFFNNCEVMTQKTFCPRGCFLDEGRDLPAVTDHGKQFMTCLINKLQPSCNGRHYMSRRLCSCAGMGKGSP
jgi:hypothetical protein